MLTEAPSAQAPAAGLKPLPAYRLNLMRVGYLLMGVGLVVVRWPSLPHASSLPAMEGVVVSMLVAMSLLAFVGVRHPMKMLPILVFEVVWKLLWLAAVAVPHLVANDMDEATGKLFSSILWVVIVIAVTPWDHVWRQYVTARGERWRRSV